MANYNLVIDTSNFKPFNITPYLQAMLTYGEAYHKREEQLNKIAEEKGLYIPPEGKYKDILDKYNQDFSVIADDFNKEMTADNVRAINNIRRRYFEEISPINKAAEAYNKYLDKLTALGPDAIIGNPYTFDDFYGGKNPAIEYRSAKEIQKVAEGVMKGLDNALMRAPELAGSIAEQYFILRQLGLDGASALSEIMKHNPMDQLTAGEATLLTKALDSVYNTFSKDTFSNEANGKIWENTVMGAIQGIQAPRYSLQTDHSYESDAQRASREYNEMQTEYYKTGKELDEMKKWLDLGYIPQMDELGNIARDKNGNVIYEYNLEEAAKRKKALTSNGSRGGSSSKLPASYVEFTGTDGKKYGVKTKGTRGRTMTVDPVIYTQDDEGNWVLLPADDLDLRLRIADEAKSRLSRSKTPQQKEEEVQEEETILNPYGKKNDGNPAR